MYYQMEPTLNDVYSRNNLLKMNDGAYIINLNGYESIRTHWVGLFVNGSTYIIW